MARITMEDCLKRVQNRFQLVNMVAKRVRQIRDGAEYLIYSPKNEDVVTCLREIAAGKIKLKKEKVQLAEPVKKEKAQLAEPVKEQKDKLDEPVKENQDQLAEPDAS
ncbi:DNA-directed RNA polymerase subunit omega [Desulfosarcina sp. BuS5]|uniref:DNA-directed RNA polymerase subunit omega n=1 Tax=Desulfosarcina sp. BuS5 TaxID=933262 RepID=UPI000A05AA7F|nr:DNA-directed RNA polymerase subunit omega [Desulfosarcina sp. BuS5]WDN89336.1 DNA-directed RNA polymerase subunit omega [Desulfosarcina sp. BuS5]